MTAEENEPLHGGGTMSPMHFGKRSVLTRRRVVLGLFMAACLGPPSRADEPVKPHEPGDLAVFVVASTSPTYIKDWVQTAPEHRPSIQRVRAVRIGTWLYISFLVTGTTSTPELFCDFVVGFRLVRPDGSILFDQPEYARGRYEGTGKPGFTMADPALDLLFDENDPVGTYNLQVAAHDRISGKRATTTYPIEVTRASSTTIPRSLLR